MNMVDLFKRSGSLWIKKISEILIAREYLGKTHQDIHQTFMKKLSEFKTIIVIWNVDKAV